MEFSKTPGTLVPATGTESLNLQELQPSAAPAGKPFLVETKQLVHFTFSVGTFFFRRGVGGGRG